MRDHIAILCVPVLRCFFFVFRLRVTLDNFSKKLSRVTRKREIDGKRFAVGKSVRRKCNMRGHESLVHDRILNLKFFQNSTSLFEFRVFVECSI